MRIKAMCAFLLLFLTELFNLINSTRDLRVLFLVTQSQFLNVAVTHNTVKNRKS